VGGATPAGWDCSGFVTYLLHHDLGLNLPSNSHTTSQQFLVWSGATTVPREQCQAGDLICWITHIAIATGPDTGIGAQNPRQGTISGPIKNLGPGTGETYVIRRVKAQQKPMVV
jgi:cell wall-associated NlpC family hydrolase